MRKTLRHVLSGMLLSTALLAGGNATAQSEEKAYNVTATVTVGENQMGVPRGEQIFLDFMLDPGLSPTPSLSRLAIEQRVNIFIDPWRWHWRLWDWLRTFVIWIPVIPNPGPDPGPLRIEAVFDDAQDMIMPMPGMPPTQRGTAFITTFNFAGDSPFFRQGRVPTMGELNSARLVGGNFRVEGPDGKQLLTGEVTLLRAFTAEEPCRGDLDGDGDVDASDVRLLRLEFGRRNCPLM